MEKCIHIYAHTTETPWRILTAIVDDSKIESWHWELRADKKTTLSYIR